MPQPALTNEPSGQRTLWAVRDYSLGITLCSGQAFRWSPEQPAVEALKPGRSRLKSANSFPTPHPPHGHPLPGERNGVRGEEDHRSLDVRRSMFDVRCSPSAWEGVIGSRWVRLRQSAQGIHAEVAESVRDWTWLAHYLQTETDLASILASFPTDPPLQEATQACRGLRLLRQEPWECLASFILSSTKRIGHIQQIIDRLCQRYGLPLAVPRGHAPAFSFPTPSRLSRETDTALRACGMGFRAPYLLAAARAVDSGSLDLVGLAKHDLAQARAALMNLRGVGEKIADCVLLFAYDFGDAFPIDVWVQRALLELYFSGRKVKPADLRSFVENHFGPYAGYAQQYLFHFMRTRPVPLTSAS